MALVPTGTIEDHHGMGISGDLAADLAEVMVHRGGIADRHDQRRRFALRRADRTKQIGRGEAEIFWRHRPAAGLPPYSGQAVLLANASLVLKPYLDSRTGRLHRRDSLELQSKSCENSACAVASARGWRGRGANQLNFIRCSSR